MKPTLRERNRYIAFEIISDKKFSKEEISRGIWNAVLRFLGELGASKASLWLIDWDQEKQRGIFKISHTELDNVKAALTLMKEIKTGENKIPAAYHTLGVSGTVKKTRQKFLKR